MQIVIVIFSAEIKNIKIDTQTISIGGIYPDIEVECKNNDGLHNFKIRKHIPPTQSHMLDPVIQEASNQIENFWTILENILNKPINPSEDIYIQHENKSISLYEKRNTMGAVLHLGRHSIIATIPKNWFTENKYRFFEKYDFDLLKRLNFAKRLADPISRYLSLYSLISSMAGDDQKKIDKLILGIDPTVQQTISPHKGKGNDATETTFTRLRNELAHHRKDASIFKTHQEIKLHIDRFQYIVDSLISEKLTTKI